MCNNVVRRDNWTVRVIARALFWGRWAARGILRTRQQSRNMRPLRGDEKLTVDEAPARNSQGDRRHHRRRRRYHGRA